MRVLGFLGLAVGMIAANYIWQALNAGEWSVAFERSFFQATALFAAWLTTLLTS